MGEYVSEPIKIERTNINTEPFFRDLTKPLLLKNEFNSYNIEYVVDNVRKSGDFGGDNHVYLYYDDIKDFVLFLQIVDITPYLKENKIVFIFGEKDFSENYPLNFKKIYGVDYENTSPKPIRIDEIKRVFIHWQLRPASGLISFFYPLWNNQPNMIYLDKSLSFVHFVAIYRCFLQGKTVLQFAEMFFTEFEDEPDWGGTWKNKIRDLFCSSESEKMESIEQALDNKFWQTLFYLFPLDYVPNDLEWLKAFAIAKAVNFEQNLNARIAPALVMFFNFASNRTAMIENNVFPFLKKFKYIRIISLIRRLTINLGAHTDDHYLDKWNLLYNITAFIQRLNPIQENRFISHFYISPNDEFLPYRKAIRFEDVKLEPIASFEALCDFFDIPFSNTLIEEKTEFKNPNNHMVTKGFQTTAVFNLHETRFSHYDYYRVEVVMAKAYEYYGYKPMYYTDGKKYTNEEIIEMFKKPFKVEEFNVTEKQKEKNEAARDWLLFCLEKRLSLPYDMDENGEKLVPIPWLKPKEEFMKGKLYE